MLVFLGVMVAAYLPMSSFLYAIKNNALQVYYPTRYFISYSLQIHSFPWWNPYINFGLPQYGDVNSGFWSPITWVIAKFLGYNAYTFTAELLLYLFLSGVGMFQLCRTYKFTKTAAYIAGFSYLCSGFMVSHLQQFNWISAAAFLPWTFWAYHQMLDKYSLKNLIVSAIVFYLFFSSAPTGLIVGGLYFFIAYFVFKFFIRKSEAGQNFSTWSYSRKHFYLFSLLGIFAFGMIVGYKNVLPHIKAADYLENLSLLTNPFSVQSIISFFMPMSTVKNTAFFGTDMSMRNAYFGLTLMLFFIPALFFPKSRQQKFFLFTGLFFLLLSFGGIFKYVTYNILPGIKYVNSPSMLMLFVIFSFILFATFSLNHFIAQKEQATATHAKSFFALQLFFLACIIIGIIGQFFYAGGFLRNIQVIATPGGLDAKLKAIVDHVSFYDILIFQGILQLIFLGFINDNLFRMRYKLMIRFCALEMIIATLLNIPFTGVGQHSVKALQSQLEKVEEGIPAPLLIPIDDIYKNEDDNKRDMTGSWSFYNKQMGVNRKIFYPMEMKNIDKAFPSSKSIFSNKPYLFTTVDTSNSSIVITRIKDNVVELIIQSNVKDTLVFQQNIYPFWKCALNGEGKKPIAYAGVFNAIALNPGKNFVKFSFNPGIVNTGAMISKYALLICMLYVLIVLFKRTSL